MNQYTTLNGEMLDEVVYRWYGSHHQLDAVMDANPGIASLGPILPEGLVVNMPIVKVEEKPIIKLWS